MGESVGEAKSEDEGRDKSGGEGDCRGKSGGGGEGENEG